MPESAELSASIAREVLDLPHPDSRVVGTYVSGSQFAGLGSPRSDIDVFHVVADEGATEQTAQVHHDGSRLDVEWRSFSLMSELADRDWSPTASSSEPQGIGGGTEHHDTLIRFSIGEILADDGRLAALQQKVRGALPNIQRSIIQWCAMDAVNVAEDLVGFIETSDTNAGVYSQRTLLYLALDALATGGGRPYRSMKWLPRRLATLELDDEVLAALEDITFARDLSGDDQPEATISLAAQILAVAQTFGWEGVPYVGAPLVVLPHGTTGTTGPRRSAGHIPVRFHDGVMMYQLRDLDDSLLISVQGLVLWAACDGVTARSDVIDTSRESLAALGFDVDRQAISDYLDHLSDRGVVVDG